MELGCIREENNELKKNVEMQKDDFQERLQEQRKRADEDYGKLQADYEALKMEAAEVQKAGEAKITALTMKLELQEQEQNKRAARMEEQLRAKFEECAEAGRLCDLQKLEIDRLTASYQLLNK